MKTCPSCGKQVPDYATKCKYCDEEIPANQPTSGAPNSALICPSCGASFPYTGGSPTVSCTYCGNTIIVASEPEARPEPQEPQVQDGDNSLPLSQKLYQLMKANDTEFAVELLRRHLSIPREDAEVLVEFFEPGQSSDGAQILRDYLRKRGG